MHTPYTTKEEKAVWMYCHKSNSTQYICVTYAAERAFYRKDLLQSQQDMHTIIYQIGRGKYPSSLRWWISVILCKWLAWQHPPQHPPIASLWTKKSDLEGTVSVESDIKPHPFLYIFISTAGNDSPLCEYVTVPRHWRLDLDWIPSVFLLAGGHPFTAFLRAMLMNVWHRYPSSTSRPQTQPANCSFTVPNQGCCSIGVSRLL